MFKPSFSKPIQENTIINEAYFGSKPVEKIQKQLTKARAKYLNQDLFKSTYKDNINLDNDMMELNRCFEEVFGFKSFSLHVYNSKQYNACTYPISNRIDTGFNPSKNLKYSQSKGYYYDKDAGYSTLVLISSGLFCNPEFTDREILAILLHEVGHNFSPSIDDYLNISSYNVRLLYYIVVLFDFVTLITNPDLYVKQLAAGSNATLAGYNKLNEKINKNFPELKKVSHIFGRGISFLKDLGVELIIALNNIIILVNPIGSLLMVLYNKLSSIDLLRFFEVYNGYRNEKFADAFATSYGYGKDLSTALDKFETKPGLMSDKIINDMPLVGTIFNLYNIPIETLSYLLDPHPKTLARINNQIEYCKMELDNINLNPKMERELRTTIKDIESYVQKAYNLSKDEKFNNSLYYKRIYAYYLLKLFGGDIREKTNPTKDIFNTMEKSKNKSSVEKIKLK